jgi:hypothetical protein
MRHLRTGFSKVNNRLKRRFLELQQTVNRMEALHIHASGCWRRLIYPQSRQVNPIFENMNDDRLPAQDRVLLLEKMDN